MPAWRVWAEGRASLPELESDWSIDDVTDANQILDMMDAQSKTRVGEGA